MDWLNDLFGVGASVASGGLFGILGSIVGVVAKGYQEKQRQEWEQKKWRYETELLKLHMQANQQETESELAIANAHGSWQGMEASYAAETSNGDTHTWVNDIKSLFRPALTIVLWLMSLYLFMTIGDKGLDVYEKGELTKYMVYTIFFCASTATMWWFGDRALAPPGLKNR